MSLSLGSYFRLVLTEVTQIITNLRGIDGSQPFKREKRGARSCPAIKLGCLFAAVEIMFLCDIFHQMRLNLLSVFYWLKKIIYICFDSFQFFSMLRQSFE